MYHISPIAGIGVHIFFYNFTKLNLVFEILLNPRGEGRGLQ